MSLAPFLAAPLHIKVHIMAALVVLAATPLQFFGPRKGSTPHRALGYLWLAAMTSVAATSLFIRSTASVSVLGFSPIHLLSVLALVSVVKAVQYARSHEMSAHRKTLIWLTVSFLIAGIFTLAPSRIMGRIVFGLG